MVKCNKCSIIIISIILLLVQSDLSTAWPDESQWNIVMKDGIPLSDPPGDAIKEKDVVGNFTTPCCYFFNDGSSLFFKMRLDDSPIQGQDQLKPFGWGLEIDSNSNLSDYEWLIMVDGNANSAALESVTIQRNTVQAIIGEPSDHAEFINRTYSPSIGGYVNITSAAGSSFGGDPDYFISWYVPYNDFLTLSGLNNFSAIRVFFGSSSNTMSLTEQGADLVGGTNMTLFTATSDWSTPMATVLTNGSIDFVDASCTGIVRSVIPGNSVYIRVNDSDRNTDNLSIQTLDVILNSSNGDIETITLTETGISSGIFTGSIPTVESAVNPSDQIFQVYSPGTVNTTYNDTNSLGQNVLINSMINVLDVDPPVWDTAPEDQTNEYGTSFSYDVNATDHTAITYSVNDTINFVINDLTGLITNYTVLNLGYYYLTITANDTSLNSNYSVIRITVQDNTAPVWDPEPIDRIVAQGSSFSFDVNAFDLSPIIYSINDIINFSIDQNTGIITNNSVLNTGSYALVINATDESSNSNSSTIMITVQLQSDEPPVITLNGISPVTIEVNSVYIDAGATASDNYDGDLTSSIVTGNSVDNTTVGTYTVTYDVTDTSGNPAFQVTRTVNVVDNFPPEWNPIPIDQIIEYGSNLSYDVNATDPSAPLIYGINDTINFTIDANGMITNITILNVSTYGLNITVSDLYGNTNFAIISITVQDTTMPVWSPPPSDQRVEFGKNFTYEVNAIDISAPISYNVNDTVNFSIDGNGIIRNNSVLNIGTYGLNISAADNYGNTIYSVITVTVQEYYKLFTLDADFNEGTFAGLEHDTLHDQLQLSKISTAFPFIWVPNYDGTISKVDTVNGKETGRYRVASTPSNPSRTTVDLQGNVWVGNRQAGTVVKVGLNEAGQCIDRNDNGDIETSQDTNGDGDITGSELLAWGIDECVLYEVVLISGNLGTFIPGAYPGGYDTNYWGTAPRGLAVDSDNNLWAGVGSSYYTGGGPSGIGIYYYINETGVINTSKTIDVSSYIHTPYGAVIDRNGILWSAHLSSHVLRINLSSDPVTITKISILNAYGLGLDFQDNLFVGGSNQLTKVNINDVPDPVLWTKPAKVIQGVTVTSDNNVWVAGNSLNSVTRYDNNGNLVATISGFSTPSGVAVDAAGNVWETDIGSEFIRRINTSTNTIDLSKRIIGSGGHYTYSDMTGFVIRGITTSTGTWNVVYDSGSAGTIWGRVSWNSYVPVGGSIEVSIRTAETEVGLQAAASLPVNNANDFYAIGRFIQIETILKANSAKESPVLYDLSIDQAGTRILGKVIENGTGIGIPGVNVYTNTSISNVTNETGYYLLNVPEGSFVLTARLEPAYYVNNTIIVNTSPEADAVQDIELVNKPTGSIMGIVTGI